MELNDKDIFSKIRDKKSEINIIYKNKYVTAFLILLFFTSFF